MTVQIDTTAEIDGVRLIQQTTHPAAPAAGHELLYVVSGSSHGGLFVKDSSGREIGPFITGSPSVVGSSYYDPDTPPASPGAYDDEFNDDTFSGWTAPASDESFNMLQTSGAVHISESIMHGWLMIQGNFAGAGAYTFYKTFTPDITQAFTVVAKVSVGANILTTDKIFGFGVRGQADNVFYELRAGRNNSSGVFRTVYANAGSTLEGVQVQQGFAGCVYLMIVHNGSKSFSSFVSGDGRGWNAIELNRSLSGATSFTRLGMFVAAGSPDGITAIDFVRYFTVSGQYKIGLDV